MKSLLGWRSLLANGSAGENHNQGRVEISTPYLRSCRLPRLPSLEQSVEVPCAGATRPKIARRVPQRYSMRSIKHFVIQVETRSWHRNTRACQVSVRSKFTQRSDWRKEIASGNRRPPAFPMVTIRYSILLATRDFNQLMWEWNSAAPADKSDSS